MRLSVVTPHRRIAGGAEQNLCIVLPELARRGVALQFIYFFDEPAGRTPILAGPATEFVNVRELGERTALQRIGGFRPDLINVHGDVSPDFQTGLLRLAPAAYSVHNYYGTCISGLKTRQLPVIQPCDRTFGAACLLQYLPRRCGGLSPLTMLRRYDMERGRLKVLSRYSAVITHSRHMQEEMLRHGLRAFLIGGLPSIPNGGSEIAAPLGDRVHLLFAGRMDKLKGGEVLLRSLPRVQATLGMPLHLHMAGDGPARVRWQRQAQNVRSANPAIRVQFHGWLDEVGLAELYRTAHLLVVPSLWPEPFGKVGPDAGGYGLPAAAFAVGGIGEWLRSGVNGMLAPGNPPTSAGLAEAISACLSDPARYQLLRQGAAASAKQFDRAAHVDQLLGLFQQVSSKPNPALTREPVFAR